jgi:hypothetical protein
MPPWPQAESNPPASPHPEFPRNHRDTILT